MSSRVREVCQQIGNFEKSIANIEVRVSAARALVAEHQRLRKHYRDSVYSLVGRRLPHAIDLAIRHESAKSLCEFAEPDSEFYSDESPLKVSVGKQIYYLATSIILLESGFFEGRSCQHGALVDKHIGRAEVIANKWQTTGLGLIITEQAYEFREYDLAAAYFKTIHSLFLGGIGFDSIKEFVRKTIDPLAFIKQFEYDIFVVSDPKTFLQEYFQSFYKTAPTYTVILQENRPAHDPRFLARLNIPGIGHVEEFGRSKTEATMLVAESAIGVLRKKKIPQFLRFEQNQITIAYQDRRCSKVKWRPDPKLLERAARWQREAHLPFRISDSELLQCFSTAASQEIFGTCFQDNGLRAQIGSHIIHVAAATPYSSLEIGQRIKIVTKYLEQTYNIARGEKLIFGTVPIHGARCRSDITQSLAFTAFLASPDQVAHTLTKLSEVALQPYSEAFSNATELASSKPFDPNISYTQILQEHTQSQHDHGRPEFTAAWYGKSHERTHKATCAYRGQSTEGTGPTLKFARNVAAYQMLRCLAGQTDD